MSKDELGFETHPSHTARLPNKRCLPRQRSPYDKHQYTWKPIHWV